jgi:A/G-specific DNA glycosylase
MPSTRIVFSAPFSATLSMRNTVASEVTEPVTRPALPDAAALVDFRRTVLTYYQAHGRDLPWRHTRDPYRILVSETMLQQTQVPRVLVKYEEFLAAFPDIGALAAAPLEAVLRAWQGLGYHRRALSLQKTAAIVATEHDGELPRSVPDLVRLPGVGPATAGAVAAFAYGAAHPFIETNIRAVYLHCFFPDRSDVTDREILPLVEATLDHIDPRSWYYALMDYGVMLKRAFPNPSRRSRHHTRQSLFLGSRRQLRAQVLRVLLDQAGDEPDAGFAEIAEIATALDEAHMPGLGQSEGATGPTGRGHSDDPKAAPLAADPRLGQVLAELVAEGFLRDDGGRYVIA